MIDRLLKFTIVIFFLLFPLFYLPIGNTSVDYDKQIILLIFSAILFLLTVVKIFSNKKITLPLTPFDGLFLLLALIYLLSSLIVSPNKMESLLSPMGAASILSLTILYFSLTQYFVESGKGDVSGRASGSAHDRSTDGRETYGRTLTLSALLLSLPIIARQFNPNINIFPLGSYYSTALFLSVIAVFLLIKRPITIITVITFITITTALSLSGYHLFTDQKPILLPATAGWAILLESYKNISHFLLGVGPNNFSAAYALGKPFFLNSTPFWNAISFMSSSYLFTAATEVGIGAFLILLIMFIRIIKLYSRLTVISSDQPTGGESRNLAKRSLRSLDPSTSFGMTQGSNWYLLPLTISFLILLLLPIQLPFLILTVVLLAAASPKTRLLQLPTSPAKRDPSLRDNFQLPTSYLTLTLLITSALLLYWPLKSYASDFFIRQSLLSNSNLLLGDSLNYSQKAISLNPYSERAYSLSSSLTLEALRNVASQTNASDSADITKSLAAQAINHAGKTTELNPQKSENWGLLGDTYQALAGLAENAETWALNAYNQQIALNPSSPQPKVSAGGLSMTSGDYETAVLLFRQAINLKPDWNNAHYNLAILYTKTGSYNYAIVELQKTLSYTPADSPDYAQVTSDLQSLQNMLNKPASPSGEL